MITKLMEWAGCLPEINCSDCPNEYCLTEEDFYYDDNYEDRCFKTLPELTFEKAWELEEMICEQLEGGTTLEKRKLSSGEFAYYTHRHDSIEDTQLEALALLIPKIDWSEQEMEQIKQILEG